jgi:hypothetical protein
MHFELFCHFPFLSEVWVGFGADGVSLKSLGGGRASHRMTGTATNWTATLS